MRDRRFVKAMVVLLCLAMLAPVFAILVDQLGS